MEAIKDAGVTKIDYLVSTHYHVDHIGGMQELTKRIPIGTFVDHGSTVEAREQVQNFQADRSLEAVPGKLDRETVPVPRIHGHGWGNRSLQRRRDRRGIGGPIDALRPPPGRAIAPAIDLAHRPDAA